MNELVKKIPLSGDIKYDCSFFVHIEETNFVKENFNNLKTTDDKINLMSYALFETEIIYGYFLEGGGYFASGMIAEKDNVFYDCIVTTKEVNIVECIIKVIPKSETDNVIKELEIEIEKAKELKNANKDFNLSFFGIESEDNYKN